MDNKPTYTHVAHLDLYLDLGAFQTESGEASAQLAFGVPREVDVVEYKSHQIIDIIANSLRSHGLIDIKGKVTLGDGDKTETEDQDKAVKSDESRLTEQQVLKLTSEVYAIHAIGGNINYVTILGNQQSEEYMTELRNKIGLKESEILVFADRGLEQEDDVLITWMSNDEDGKTEMKTTNLNFEMEEN